ncbi:MAG: YraN family protein [Lachnospiraceae bacterium]|nr:YraN family protein [Lachnospiraceae bacterium]
MNDRKLLGALGEEMAVSILYAQGFDIEERNYTCRHGEIDIIARRGQELAFVEVKTRMEPMLGRPSEAVTRQKQKRMRRIAGEYTCYKRLDVYVTFQVIEISVNQIENAF